MYLSVLSFFLPTGWIEHGEEMNACTFMYIPFGWPVLYAVRADSVCQRLHSGVLEIIIFSNMLNAATSILPICSVQ
jgi:hypothetical protein